MDSKVAADEDLVEYEYNKPTFLGGAFLGGAAWHCPW
jgi:hypothetical protein